MDGKKKYQEKNEQEAIAEHKNQEWLEQVVVFATGQRGFQSPFSQTLRAHIFFLSVSQRAPEHRDRQQAIGFLQVGTVALWP